MADTMSIENYLFVGIKKKVLALDQKTGATVWETGLEGSAMGDSFVNIFFDGGLLFAHTKGMLFCINPSNGELKWTNALEGCGFGIATLASANSSTSNLSAILRKMRQEQEQAAASGTAGAGAG
jgi:outer membrane protein assembly factor BamB